MKSSVQLLWSAAVAALGGLLFGFDTAVIAGTTKALARIIDLFANELGFTVASALPRHRCSARSPRATRATGTAGAPALRAPWPCSTWSPRSAAPFPGIGISLLICSG